MSFNPFSQELFDVRAPCMPCCTTPTECACAMLIPPFTSPYADYATAATAIADLVASCQMYALDGAGGQLDVYTIAVTTGIAVALSSTTNPTGDGWISISLKAGDTISVSASVTADGTNPARPAAIVATLYDCNGALIDQDIITGSETAASGTLALSVPSNGVYYLLLEGGGAGDATVFSYTSTTTFTDVFVVNPVIALWDDSGTTRQLEACPKLYLPILTESTGDWYASCADAATDITDFTSNCVGYAPAASPGVYDFLATDGGSSLTLQMTLATPDIGGLFTYGSVNAEAGETITSTGSNNGTGSKTTVLVVFDDTGTAIGTYVGTAGSPAVSGALPYTGRYIIRTYNLNTGFDGTVFTCVLTSSGTMTVNPIQALYDAGLDCAERLNCGDSC